MISFELAKKLKDAGFPQHANLDECELYGCFGDQPCQPMLSELIEKMEERFGVDDPRTYFRFEKYGDEWICASDALDVSEWNLFGKTLEEAAAKLYLELEKKWLETKNR